MRQYETCFIVNPQTDDAAIERHVNAVRDHIQENGGKILEEDRMGTRRLAYPIQGLTQGYYTAMIFEGTGDLVSSLDRFLKLEEPYVRHLTIRWDNRKMVVRKKPEDEEAEAQQAGEQPEASAPAPRPQGSGRREEPSEAVPQATATAEASAETEEEKPAAEPAADQPAAESSETEQAESGESEDTDKTE
jgi:small subunit ribosomal protein S6